MRLAVLGPSRHHLREPFAGGQESFVAAIVEEFRDRGHHVTLYAADGTPASLADVLRVYPDLPPLSASAVDDPLMPARHVLADQHATAWAIADLAGRADLDVVLNHSLSGIPLSLAALLGAPVLTTLHTPPLPWMETGAVLTPTSSRFVAVSSALAAQWTTLPRVEVVLNGVDERRFLPGPGGEDLVWVGRITPEKGLPVAIRAARLAGRRLRVVGPVSDPLHFEEVVAPLLGDDVVHVGHLPHERIRMLLATSAACVVTPRWDEPFGLVAAEALMCGTPVAALARGGLPEVVGDVGGVLVTDPGDDELAARALAGVLPAVTRLDRAAVRADAVERLSLTTMVDRYEGILGEMVPPATPFGGTPPLTPITSITPAPSIAPAPSITPGSPRPSTVRGQARSR